jgi:hypothetical protein
VTSIVAAAADGSDSVALRKKQLKDQDIGHIPAELEAGQRPERKNTADRSLKYESYIGSSYIDSSKR